MKRMDDEELKRLLKEGMEYEADLIMKEVESDPNMKDVVAPESIHENLWKQIHEQQAVEEQENDEQKKEEEELIRLGKKYKKKLGRRKYYVLIAAIVCLFALGTVSLGDGKNVFQEMKRKLGDREQTVVNSGDGDTSFAKDIATEEEAYEEINDKFGFYPVPMHYLPDGTEFVESEMNEESQYAQIYYKGTANKVVLYRVVTDYRTGSVSSDIEDPLIQEYEKQLEGVSISLKEYKVEENDTKRWLITFAYKDAQYSIVLTGVEYEEVEKVIENLYFS